MAIKMLLIFLGGGLGSIARWITGQLIVDSFQKINPLGTFFANIISSILLAVIIFLFKEKLSNIDHLKLFLITGFCGGFSTFSTFSYETFELIRLGLIHIAIINAIVSIATALFIIFIIYKASFLG